MRRNPESPHMDFDDGLRRRAESRLLSMGRVQPPSLCGDEVLRQLHELQVHQVELELQNEELCRINAELSDNRELNSRILQSLPARIAVIDRHGMIIAVNRSWTDFQLRNGLPVRGVGSDYLDASHLAVTYGESAPKVRNGIESVLGGASSPFVMEHLCVTPTEGRQLNLVTVVPLSDGDDGCVISHYDITESKRVEDALKASEEHFQLLFERSGVGIALVRADDQVISRVNEKFCTLFGYSSEALYGVDVLTLIHPNSRQACNQKFRSLASGGLCDFTQETRCLHHNGSIIWVSFVVSNMELGAPDQQCHIVVAQETTLRKLAEDALKSSEERYEHLFEMNLNGVLLIESGTGAILDSNTAGLTMYGHSRAAMLGLTFSDLSAGTDDANVWLQEDHAYFPLQWHTRRDGSSFPAEISARCFEYHGRMVQVAAIRDISDRVRDEEKLKIALENNRSLHEHMQKAIEDERIAISRDIHDDLGQSLSILRLGIESLMEQRGMEEARPQLGRLYKNTDLAIETIRRIAGNLRPPLLDSIGLTAAIEWQAHEFRKYSGIECFVMLNNHVDYLDKQRSTALIRIVQEGLTNVVRHAEASEVALSLCERGGELILEISDDGCGITEKELRASTSYGMMGMEERARSCRGELQVLGTPGVGTVLRLTLPLEEA